MVVIELHTNAEADLVQAHLSAKNITHQLTNPETKVDCRYVLLGFKTSVAKSDLLKKLLAKETDRPALNEQSMTVLKFHLKNNSSYAILGYSGKARDLIAKPGQNYHHIGARKL